MRENKFTITFWKDTNGGFRYVKFDKEGTREEEFQLPTEFLLELFALNDFTRA